MGQAIDVPAGDSLRAQRDVRVRASIAGGDGGVITEGHSIASLAAASVAGDRHPGHAAAAPDDMLGVDAELRQHLAATRLHDLAAELARACGVPIHGMDERLTSEAADTVLKNRDLKGRERKRRIDSAAATKNLPR